MRVAIYSFESANIDLLPFINAWEIPMCNEGRKFLKIRGSRDGR
jgi:hypothetical protein